MINFLLDYYLWILGGLAIIIITVIGFLVDSKQKRKKKAINEVKISDEVNTVEVLPDSNQQNIVPVVDAVNQPVPTVVDNVIGGDGTYSPQTVQTSQTLPIENINASSMSFDYNQGGQVLSQQTPHFESSNVQMTNIPNSMNQVVAPRPVNSVPINQTVQQVVNQNSLTGQPQQYNSVNNQQQSFGAGYDGVNNNFVSNVSQPVVNSVYGLNNANQSGSNLQTNMTSNMNQVSLNQNMQPVNNAVGQSVNYNVAQPIQQVSTQNVVPQQSTFVSSQPYHTSNDVGINFVTGESSQPVVSDDTWKL